MPLGAIAPFIPLIGGALGLLGARNAPEQQTSSTGGSTSGAQNSLATSTTGTQIDPRLQQIASQMLPNVFQGGRVAPPVGIG